MIAILSPAKRIANSRRFSDTTFSEIRFPAESKQLIKFLRSLSPDDLSRLMKINSQLAEVNYNRFQHWHFPFGDDALHAAAAFDGEVYNGLKAITLSTEDIAFASLHLRILSGLYGILRPTDGILPYRLEMATPLQLKNSVNLYEFWGKKIAKTLQADLADQGDNILINLASDEYSKSVLPHLNRKTKVITPVFKEFKNGKLITVIIFTKKARGLMSRFIIENRLSNPKHLKAFDTEGYIYNTSMSDESRFIFVRG